MNKIKVTAHIPVFEYASMIVDDVIEELLRDTSFRDVWHLAYDNDDRRDVDQALVAIVEKHLKEIQ